MISSDKILLIILLFFISAGLVGEFFFRRSLRNANLFLTSLVATTALLLSFFYINKNSGIVLLSYDVGLDIGFFSYDSISLVLFTVITVFYLIFLIFRSFVIFASESFLLEITGVVFSVVGLWLAIFSSTAWALIGALAILGVASTFQDRHSMLSLDGSSAVLKSFFLKFTSWALLLGGVVVIASAGGPTSWRDTMGILPFNTNLMIGITLLFAGALVGFQSFPAYPIDCEKSQKRRAFYLDWPLYWFPVTATFIMFLRAYPLYSEGQIKSPLLLVLVISALFSFISSLVESEVEKTFSKVRSGAMAFTLAVLVDQGPLEGLVLFIAIFIGSTFFRFIESNGSKPSYYIRAALKLLLALLILGGPGVVSSLPLVSWFSISKDQSAPFFALNTTAYFLFSASVWKLLFMKSDSLLQGKNIVELGVVSFFSILMASSVLWSGDWFFLGGHGSKAGLKSDLWPGLFSLFGVEIQGTVKKDFLTAFLIQMGIFSLSAAISFWFVIKKPNSIGLFSASWPRTVRFIQSGYGVREALHWIRIQLIGFSILDQYYLQEQFWKQKLPKFFERTMIGLSKFVFRVDEFTRSVVKGSVTKGVSSFTKVSQLVQSGDFQWYLVIGLIVALVMILNILRG